MRATTREDSVVHGSFSIERVYPSPPARVFAAFANQRTKRRWFAGGEGWEIDEFAMDFRVGGRETWRYRFRGGPLSGNDTVYLDIVPDRRIVLAYTMLAGDRRISVSLATMEIAPTPNGSCLTYTEQGAFFEGAGDRAGREAGCRDLLDRLGDELRAQSHEV